MSLEPVQIEVLGVEPERLYTASEVAALLQRHEQWAYHAVRRGDLRSVKIGSARMFEGAAVIEFVKNLCRRSRALKRSITHNPKKKWPPA